MTVTMQYIAIGIQWGTPDSESGAGRDCGPCCVQNNGAVYFSQLSEAHNRRSGPAIIHADGFVRFNDTHGRTHRTDGPAVIWPDGSKVYGVAGRELSADEFFLKYGQL